PRRRRYPGGVRLPRPSLPAVALLALLSSCGVALADDGQRHQRLALIVTVERYYTVTLKLLEHADDDGLRLAAALRGGGYDVELLNTVPGKVDRTRLATLDNVRAHVRARAAEAQAGDTLVFAFIGHGLQGTKPDDQFFCLRDSEADRFDSMLPTAEVFRALEESRASQKILLLDVSRQAPTRRVSVPTVDEVRVPVRGVGVLVSCRRLEFGIESADLGAGLFAYRLAEGLSGAAADGRGRVTWEGLSRYVRDRVPEDAWRGSDRTSSSQHPVELAPPANPKVVLLTVAPPAVNDAEDVRADPRVAADGPTKAAPPRPSAADEPRPGPASGSRFLRPPVQEADVPDRADSTRLLAVLGLLAGGTLLLLLVLLFAAWANQCSLTRAAVLMVEGPVSSAVTAGRRVVAAVGASGGRMDWTLVRLCQRCGAVRRRDDGPGASCPACGHSSS
ncbi:MAG TPA: hypothetical protein VKE40_07025, partial [Gemmataceae bacterium]|nr:hypothetical protein [Gemmataceae bacterium]